MKSFIKYCLILLTLAGFTALTFELNKEEFKQNFNKEEHAYITTANSGSGQDCPIDRPVALPENPFRIVVEEKFIQQLQPYTFFSDPDPPSALYILNSVFRI